MMMPTVNQLARYMSATQVHRPSTMTAAMPLFHEIQTGALDAQESETKPKVMRFADHVRIVSETGFNNQET